jgi:uncharacterized protein (DUF1499 family)
MKVVKILLGSVLLFFSLLLQGCKPVPTPNFQNLTLPKFPNHYLVCPDSYCNVTPNVVSPIYPESAEDLFTDFNQMISQQPRTTFVYSMPETGQYVLVQKSLIFGFPDDITVQFIALPNNQSTLAIYSKSRYGFYDFDMNKKRLESWLQQLGQIVAGDAESEAQAEGIATEQPVPNSTTATPAQNTTNTAP